MTEFGTVVECKKNFIQVRIGRNSACASCGKCGMTENQKHVDFFVENTLNARLGDKVEVEIPDASTVSLALVAYVLPLIPALILMFVSMYLKWPEWASLLMFAAGAVVGFGAVIVIDRLRKHKWMQSPTLISVIPQKAEALKTDEQENTSQPELKLAEEADSENKTEKEKKDE